ncbi:MAG: hypothetical protein K0S08_383 [Gammaproteobacteria bacterium]|nr:hypothetical protein [Gammaproteobacteria bacterium]
MLTEEFITEVFCWIEEPLQKLSCGKRISSRRPDARLCDSAVICMEIVGEFLGYHEGKTIKRDTNNDTSKKMD